MGESEIRYPCEVGGDLLGTVRYASIRIERHSSASSKSSSYVVMSGASPCSREP